MMILNNQTVEIIRKHLNWLNKKKNINLNIIMSLLSPTLACNSYYDVMKFVRVSFYEIHNEKHKT